jgi:hypothetical protein
MRSGVAGIETRAPDANAVEGLKAAGSCRIMGG